jgi:uncharacterized membrane protein YkoI
MRCAVTRLLVTRLLVTCLLLGWIVGSAIAGMPPGLAPARTPFLQVSQTAITLDEAIVLVRSRVPGEVLRAETRMDPTGGPVHHLRVLTPEGRVQQWRVHAQTGRIE